MSSSTEVMLFGNSPIISSKWDLLKLFWSPLQVYCVEVVGTFFQAANTEIMNSDFPSFLSKQSWELPFIWYWCTEDLLETR